MEEKIIEAKFTKNRFAIAILLISLGLLIVGFAMAHNDYITGTSWKDFGWGYGGFYPSTQVYGSFGPFFWDCFLYPFDLGGVFIYIIYLGILGLLLSLFFFWEMSRCALTITTRRVSGKASFGKAVDLPLNQISAVGLGSLRKITVATSSGKLHFWFVKNRTEVHAALTDIIGKVQVEAAYAQNNSQANSNADEIKKYKELLDTGIITQEEFDAKKKQLLGL